MVTGTTLTVVAGGVGLIVGWFVAGYQRLAEQLMAERRDAYAQLLAQAERVRSNSVRNDDDFELAIARSRLLCSSHMHRNQAIERLIQATNDGRAQWERECKQFIDRARMDSIQGSMWWRIIHRRVYAGSDIGLDRATGR